MDIISYVEKSVELLFQILGLVEIWTRRLCPRSKGTPVEKWNFELEPLSLLNSFCLFMTGSQLALLMSKAYRK